jgi:hypothetical protein
MHRHTTKTDFGQTTVIYPVNIPLSIKKVWL